MSEKSKECPDIEDCPLENIVFDESGCCKICNQTNSPLSDCSPIPVSNTIALINEVHPQFGSCHNQRPIPGFQQCEGHCSSKTIYVSGKKLINLTYHLIFYNFNYSFIKS